LVNRRHEKIEKPQGGGKTAHFGRNLLFWDSFTKGVGTSGKREGELLRRATLPERKRLSMGKEAFILGKL